MRRKTNLKIMNKKAIALFILSYFLPIVFSQVVNLKKFDIHEPMVIGSFVIVLVISWVGILMAHEILYRRY